MGARAGGGGCCGDGRGAATISCSPPLLPSATKGSSTVPVVAEQRLYLSFQSDPRGGDAAGPHSVSAAGAGAPPEKYDAVIL